MTSIIDLWINNKDFLIGKSIQQVISICGDGKLSDGSTASTEFRAFLKNIPSRLLADYANECLEGSFTNSGIVLQDIINETGSRIGFDVEHGLYRGKSNKIGFDGIWHSLNGYATIVEVKTTDAYRVNLDTISNYRLQLIEEGKARKDSSSILIVVGRKDTGDLEAQIRGSKHAWDIRLISIASLVKLMFLRETLNDSKTIQQINEILKPQEYTRIDRLIDIIFMTSKDIKAEEIEESEIEDDIAEGETISTEDQEPKFHPVNFHEECIERIQKYLKQPLIKKSRSSYGNAENSLALICSISKRHKTKSSTKYWFAFHPYYEDFLKEAKTSYIAYGCGSSENVLLIPFNEFQPLIGDMWTTENEDRMYRHVVIHEKNGKFLLQIPKRKEMRDITDRLL